MTLQFSGVVAMDPHRGIGLNGGLPWRLREDLAHFKRITMGHPILMGRRTWESLGRPLPGRQNIVLTHSAGYAAEGATVITDTEQLKTMELQNEEVMVIGGAQVYELMLPHMQKLYVSEVAAVYEADTFFPPFRHLFTHREVLGEYADFTAALYTV